MNDNQVKGHLLYGDYNKRDHQGITRGITRGITICQWQ